MTEKKTPEQAAEEYFAAHRFLCDVINGPENVDFPSGRHLALPGDEYGKQIRTAFLAGGQHFIEHELYDLLDMARERRSYSEWEHSIPAIIAKARRPS